jgi:predicted dehydrogenase
MDHARAAAAVEACERAGVVLGVNQNMRYDHSIRALRGLLAEGRLGEPVMAQITMHARVGFMPYAESYRRRAMLIMSVHHLDAFRFLFGEPLSVSATTRRAAEEPENPADGMATYTLVFPDGLLAVAIDNMFSRTWQGIEWRVDGTEGVAEGSVGWMDHPWGSASTLRLRREDDPTVLEPTWTRRWFPHAFAATMAEVLEAVANGTEPSISGRDNLKTMALLEAAYRSAEQGRTVEIAEVG